MLNRFRVVPEPQVARSPPNLCLNSCEEVFFHQFRVFYGDILDHVKYRGSTSREINIDLPNFTSGDDMEGLLKAAFGVDMPKCKDDILHDVVDEPLDEETLAEIGRDARASQTHCHTTGSTSYAEKRANFVCFLLFLLQFISHHYSKFGQLLLDCQNFPTYLLCKKRFVETHGREPTHLEFFKETHGKDGGGFVANTATESFLTEASAKVQEQLLSSSPSKTQVEIETKCLMSLCMKKKILSDRSVLALMWTEVIGYIFPDNNMKLKHVKEELASQKAMFLHMLKAVRNGKITDEFLDATEAALRMAGDQVPQESSGNNVSNESGHAGPSTSASQVN
ncbi:hypothetical protein Cgig2_017714 [Carnegiea gigantea]|uniref:Uncharacterized protein n=1 Tax=Carnegiea gigantea TaxID=171969 RepID=A0A9Q1QCF2_9CARY|nr:hypothetical protein Cgig2_017714 [Carnegiea gigantea]